MEKELIQKLEAHIRANASRKEVEVTAREAMKRKVISTELGDGDLDTMISRLTAIFRNAATELKCDISDIKMSNCTTNSYVYMTRLETDVEFDERIKDEIRWATEIARCDEARKNADIAAKQKRIQKLEQELADLKK